MLATESKTFLNSLGAEIIDFIYGDENIELIANGNFADDSIWTFGGKWLWEEDGYARHQISEEEDKLLHTFTPVAGRTYQVTYTLKFYITGEVWIKLGGKNGTARSANDTYTEIITTLSTAAFRFIASTDFRGSIDDVSIKRIKVSRNISAIVNRRQPVGMGGAPQGKSPLLEITVANDSTIGISSDEINLGQNRVNLSVNIGESPQDRRITKILSMDSGMMKLEVR